MAHLHGCGVGLGQFVPLQGIRAKKVPSTPHSGTSQESNCRKERRREGGRRWPVAGMRPWLAGSEVNEEIVISSPRFYLQYVVCQQRHHRESEPSEARKQPLHLRLQGSTESSPPPPPPPPPSPLSLSLYSRALLARPRPLSPSLAAAPCSLDSLAGSRQPCPPLP